MNFSLILSHDIALIIFRTAPIATVSQNSEDFSRYDHQRLIDKIQSAKSYGIIDKDSDQDPFQIHHSVKNYIIKAKRYSLENYLYDPFIFCSNLEKKQIEAFVEESLIT